MRLIALKILFLVASAFSKQQDDEKSGMLSYTINTTWDGKPLLVEDHINITLKGTTDGVRIQLESPYYNDNEPNCKAMMNRTALWKCEAVDLFFANEKDEYFLIQLSPYGEQIAWFFIGERNYVRNSIRSVFEARILNSTWSGSANIPMEYFHINVTKFNAGSFHGEADLRKYNTLYPADESVKKADFHKLRFFKPIDMAVLGIQNLENSSPIWDSINKGNLNFTIMTTWNGKPLLPYDQINITLDGVTNSDGIEVRVEAPFYNDNDPDCKPGLNIKPLWECEVVELFFLNNNQEYLEVHLTPFGERAALLFKGERKYISRNLTLNFKYTASINGSKWNGTALIPKEYFPLEVRRFNAYSIHGLDENRTFNSLYSADETATEPDFHKLYYFQPIDMALIRGFYTKYSPIWESALGRKLNFTIGTTWNGLSLPSEDQINITLDATKSDCFCVQIAAPFYDDNEPNCRPGPNRTSLWMCEAVEVYFLNDKNEYLQLMFDPHGRSEAIFLNGTRNYIAFNLTLEFRSNISGSMWSGHASVPREYFPANVTKFNAASFHGFGDSRKYNALYPADENVTDPDFHLLRFFKPLNMPSLRLSHNSSSIWEAAPRGFMNFTIDKTWDGKPLLEKQHINLTLSRSNDPRGIRINIRAPFNNENNSTFCLSGKKNYYLFSCEVVEVFFLNDEDAYLQIQFSPHGYQFVQFFNGVRNTIRRDLPLDFKADILGSVWEGSVFIPKEYFPKRVSKFNAASMHRNGDERQFNTLYPADNSVSNPDFHLLRFFNPIDVSSLGIFNFEYPPLWRTAFKGQLNYTIKTSWNGSELALQDHINVTLKKATESEGVCIHVQAPFYDDNDSNCKEELNKTQLWQCEAVELYFLNDLDEYLQIMLSPFGEYEVEFFNGERNSLRHSFNLNFTATISNSSWTGSAFVPREYFQYRVTKFNAASQHGVGETRKYNTLYPADDSVSVPDFHLLRFFKPIDVSPLGVYNIYYPDVWKLELVEKSENSTKS